MGDLYYMQKDQGVDCGHFSRITMLVVTFFVSSMFVKHVAKEHLAWIVPLVETSPVRTLFVGTFWTAEWVSSNLSF